MQKTEETQVQSLARENYLEEGMATHSSILAWEISWTEEASALGTPLGLAHWKRASSPVEAGTAGYL